MLPRGSRGIGVAGPRGRRRLAHCIIATVTSRHGFLLLGSNLDEPLANLQAAVRALRERSVFVSRLSSVYETEPVDAPAPGSPWFLNAAAAVSFQGSPLRLLRVCQEIEADRGRLRLGRNAPRTLDIDILLWGSDVVRTEKLTVPHPRLSERRFVLVPMSEIAPDVVDPISGLPMRELLARCEDPSTVVLHASAAVLTSCA